LRPYRSRSSLGITTQPLEEMVAVDIRTPFQVIRFFKEYTIILAVLPKTVNNGR
jgi:hypothetical protein